MGVGRARNVIIRFVTAHNLRRVFVRELDLSPLMACLAVHASKSSVSLSFSL